MQIIEALDRRIILPSFYFLFAEFRFLLTEMECARIDLDATIDCGAVSKILIVIGRGRRGLVNQN